MVSGNCSNTSRNLFGVWSETWPNYEGFGSLDYLLTVQAPRMTSPDPQPPPPLMKATQLHQSSKSLLWSGGAGLVLGESARSGCNSKAVSHGIQCGDTFGPRCKEREPTCRIGGPRCKKTLGDARLRRTCRIGGPTCKEREPTCRIGGPRCKKSSGRCEASADV